jgi:hypothetical protein
MAAAAGGPSGFLGSRIVHLHPTRLCNLACTHCYSFSGPEERGELAAAALLPALARLRGEGYEQVSLSGGEPLVYRELPALLGGLKAQGWRVTMVSNGLLADARHEALLAPLDGLAVSFDGPEAVHDEVRGRRGAFERACAALRQAADRGRPAAAAVSLARSALPELPELLDTLLEHGAHGFQIRPVARAGRGAMLAPGSFYSAADRARLVLVVEALRHELPGVPLHCDLAPAQALWRQRDDYAALLATCASGRGDAEALLSDIVNPLVIDERGVLKPLAYDFDARFDIAHIGDPPARLAAGKARVAPLLRALIGRLLAEQRDSHDFIDWFDHCARESARTPGSEAAAAA